MDWNRLLKKIEKYDYVSFDIFDTLVYRMMPSNNTLYELEEITYTLRFNEKLEDYKEYRKSVEYNLWNLTRKGEFTFDRIFEEISRRYGKERSDRLKKIELELEKKFIVKNDIIYEIYKKVIKNKKVIITSDMYLDEEFINKVLSDLGYDAYYRLYISGKKRGSKAEGDLFEIISKELGTRRIIHIGDSFKGDYLMPILHGWHSVKINRFVYSYIDVKKCKSVSDELLLGICKKGNTDNYWKKLGYTVLGPLLLGFASWIESEIKSNEYEKIIFIARDGYIVDKAFKVLYGDKYKTEYLYVSRKAATIATMNCTEGIEKVLRSFSFRKKEKLSNVLKRMDIRLDDREDAEIDVDREDLYKGKYNEILDKYYEIIKKNADEQREYFQNYLKRIFEEKSVVVDVGWHGTIQNCIRKLLEEKYSIYGLYLGLEKDCGHHKKAYLDKRYFDSNMIPFTRGIFESFFSAPHGTTERYCITNGVVEPVLSKQLLNSETQNKLTMLQESALEYIKEYKKIISYIGLNDIKVNSELISEMILKLCNNPTNFDALCLGDLLFNDIDNRKLIDIRDGDLRYNIS